MKLSNLEDILEIAVRIERAGVALYRRLYDEAAAPQAREIYAILAADEERHLGAFRQMLEQTATYTPRYCYPGEYGAFIEGVAKRLIDRAHQAAGTPPGCGVRSLLEAALTLEEETILFYLDCSQHAEDERLNAGIQTIINEERQHWVRLQALKAALLKDQPANA